MNAIIEGLLQAGHQIKVLAIDSWKFPVNMQAIPDEYLKGTRFESVFVDLEIKPFKAFCNLFTGKSYHVERFISQNYEDKLISILKNEKFDIIQIETLYLSPYINTIRKYSDAKVILRAHNVEHKIWERITINCKNPLKKLYLKHLTRTLKKYELEAIHKYDGIATISSVDEAFFKQYNCKVPVITIGFGIDLDRLKIVDTETEFPGFFHIGSMNWMPNLEGVNWFIDNVWTIINSVNPELKLYLAGRHMPEWLHNSKFQNVEIVGEVDDAYEFISSKSIMIVPLFSGSGIRIKIIEGMALGKTVISTKTGADGINYTDGENILIADTTDAFIAAITKCIINKDLCDEIGNKAKELIAKEHNNEIIIKKLVSFYNEIIFHTNSATNDVKNANQNTE